MSQEVGLTSAPLSRGQRALWFLERLNPGRSAYVVAGAGRVRDPLDGGALERALAALAGRHPLLCATFHDSPAGPCRRGGGALPEVLELDAAVLDPAGLAARLQEIAFRPFDLARGPLLRAAVLRTGEEAVLALSVHHIVSDFWSLGVIVRELGALYHEQTGGPPAELPAPEITYDEWTAAEEERLAGPEGRLLWEHWRDVLHGVPTVLELPTDRPRPPVQGYRGGAIELRLDAAATRRLGRLGRGHGATLAMTLLAGFGALLGRWAGQERLLIGMPTTGRRSREVAGLVGYLVNPVAVGIDLRGDPGFGELLERVRESARGAFEHQEYPLPLLAERLQPERDPSRPPLVQVAAVLQKARKAGEEGIAALWAGRSGARVPFGPLELESVALEEPGAQFDLALGLAEWRGELVGRIQYDRDLFDGATVRRLAAQLERVLRAVAAEPGLRVSELPLLGAGERQQVLVEWNDTAVGAGEGEGAAATALEQFEAWARRAPEAPAVGWAEGLWSYGELDARAERLGEKLRELGAGPGDVVGVCLERSPELVAAVLAAGKCGAAYLPLDPAHPAERLRWQLADAGVRVVVTGEGRAEIAPAGVPVAAVEFQEGRNGASEGDRDGEPGRDRSASLDVRGPGDGALPPCRGGTGRGDSFDTLAYVIYTSGSTGRPKGMLLGQRGLANLVSWHRRTYGLSPAARSTLVAGVGFDASVWELWPALASGASLWIPPAEVVASPPALAAWIAGQGITCCFLPTPLAEAVLDEGLPADHRLEVLLTGGDRLHRSAPAGSRFRLVNHYGPTESTVVATSWDVPAGTAGAPPIGRPIAGLRALLLDRTLQPVPPGLVGELYVGGEALAWGYLGRPELTAASFLPDPFGEATGGCSAGSGDRPNAGTRLYRTGDLARFRPDGALEFLGRADQQVKVRGHRIEIGEIEAVLASHPDLREAAVLVRGQGRDARLVACLAPRPGADPSPSGLRGWLGERLPAALVPSGWVLLEALPLTANGKVDRRALAEAAGRAQVAAAGDAFQAPATPTEQALARIWSGLLGVERVGRADHFFELGGHSLLAARLIAHLRETFGVELPVVRVFEAPTLAALAAEVDRAQAGARPASPHLLPADRSRPLPLSFAQERLWFLEQMEPGSAVYNVPGGLRLRGPLDAAALAGALDAVVARHEALRTAFQMAPDGSSPVQVIASSVALSLPCLDLSALPAARREPVLCEVAGEEARRPFDLARPPLLRARLIRLGAEDHALLLTLHHLVCDGWSLGLMVRELSALYRAALAGEPALLPPLPAQYADFAAWQRRALAGGPELADQLAFWRDRLAGLPAALELPADLPRPAVQSPRGGQLPVRWGAALSRDVRGLARREGATPFAVLFAAFAALLGRLTGRCDLAVGTPVAGRTVPGTEGLVGLFVNTLVLRSDLAGDPPFRVLLARTRRTLLDAAAHQDLPFEKLVEALAPERDRSRPPLVQVVLADQAAPLAGLALPGLDCAVLEIESGTAKFDLALSLDERDGEIAGYLEYCRDLFHRATARRFLEQLDRLLAGAVAEPEARVSELPLLGAGEHQQVVVEWNDTEPAEGEDRTVLAQFEGWARRAPGAPAVGTPERIWSYGELDARAEGLAGRLRGLGVGEGEVVGICLERSPELVMAVLAAGKCGAAYLPLDPAHPGERLSWQLVDAGVRVLVADGRGAEIAPAGVALAAVEFQSGWNAASEGDRGGEPGPLGLDGLAYVIYTSGSTGRPKGTLLGQRGLANLVAWHRRTYGLTPASRTTLVAGVGFDASAWEMWPALASGASLWIPPADVVTSPPALGRFLADHGITSCFLPTPVAEALLDEGLPEDHCLEALLTGGDRLHRAAPAGSRFRLVNHYGPTESTVVATSWEVPAGSAGAPPIGRPIAGTRALLLDRTLQPVPLGAVGELYVGGAGLAWGYLGRAELTARSFLPDPFVGIPQRAGEPAGAHESVRGRNQHGAPGARSIDRNGAPGARLIDRNGAPGARLIDRNGALGARLYCTGDLARLRPDGALEFLGRADQQVKVRGHRIELGEIEAVLAGHPALREAAVLVAGEGRDARLVAYVVPRTPGVADSSALRAWLGERLPAALVPAAWVTLDALPLTANGKVDRRALAGLAVPESAGGWQAPATPTEQVLAALWADLLGAGRIGREDHFFHLGGHSLLATRLAGAIRSAFGVELGVARLFEAPTLAAQAAELDAALRDAGPGASPPDLAPLAPAERGAGLPASFAQERLWFLDRLEPGNPAYNIAGGARLTGALDAAALAAALARIVERHEALRTTFAEVDGRPVQVVGPAVPPGGPAPVLPLVDLSGLPAAARTTEAGRQTSDEAARPFDLARGPLLRTVLLREREDRHRLLLTLHHIVGDGWSMGVLVRELTELYRALAQGEPPRLPALPVQYADYAAWQRRWLSGPALERELAWWRERLAGAPTALELPSDRPRGPLQSARGALLPAPLPPGLGRDLEALARRAGATPFMVLLAAFGALLLRWTGQDDLLVGSPVAHRTRPETEPLIGFFVNTLVLRGELAGDPTFGELLGRVRSTTLGAYAHQDVPFEKLVEELAPQRDRSRTPLFQVMLALQNVPPLRLELPDLQIQQLPPESAAAKFDLTLTLSGEGEALAALLEYRLELFDRSTIERLAGHLETLLAVALEEPGRRLSELPLLTAGEQEQLRAWNRTGAPLPERPLLAPFVERAAAAPQEIALVAGDRRLTYGELRTAVDRLAQRLTAIGVRPGLRVGLGLDRCAELVVGLLAVLEAGGAYVPLDPAEPAGRLERKLAEAGLHALITVERLAGRFPATGRDLPRLVLDAEPGSDDTAPPAPRRATGDAGPDDPAYLIFTSGSTGVPKAAGVTRRGLSNLLQWYIRELNLHAEDQVLVISAPGFDLTQKNLLAPLLAGGTVVLGPEVYDPSRLVGLIAREGITRINCTPSAFYPLLEAGGRHRLDSLATVCLGGEAILPGRLASWFGSTHCRAEVLNTYGPTECSDVVSCHRLSPLEAGTVPIGRPVPNARLVVLDRFLREQPVGVPGELAVGGLCVGLGYLGDPAATAARFVPDPEAAEPGARLYLTGDLARRRRDGNLEFLGRVDHQVKVRGFRVELGEIEAVLASLPGVRQAAVAVWPDAMGALQLAAYAAGESLTAATLRDGLAAHLPAPLVPTAYVILDRLPLNAHGKIDRRALPPPAPAAEARGDDCTPPRTPAEELLAGIFAELLGRPRVGIRDDFFALGGHSLLATRLASRVRGLFGVELPVARLFAAPTVEALAREIAAGAAEPALPPLPPIVPLPRRPGDPLPLSFSQERLWFLDQLEPGSPAYNIPAPVRLRGALNVAALHGALAGLAVRHETLRTRFAAGADGSPVQMVASPALPALAVVDLTGLEPERRAAAAAALARQEARRPFDLARGPLLRTSLLREREDEHLLLITLHHIVGDGWSMGVLVREVAALYRAALAGRPPELPEPAVQYADFAAWQRRCLAGAALDRQLAWWRERLAGAPAALELPADRPRGPVQSPHGALLPLAAPAGLGGALEALARRAGATPFMVLLAAFDALLLRWSGQDDLLVGSPIAGRTRLETEGLIGFFVNTLVLRAEVAGDPPFGELLARVRSTTLGAYAHQDVPFEKLVEELAPPRDRSRTPLFQVMLALQNALPAALELPGLAIEQLLPDSGTAKFDLTLTLTGAGEGLGGALEYRLELFDRGTVERLAGHLWTLLAGAVEEPDRRLSELPLLTCGEQEQLRAWNRTAAPLAARSVVELFAERAAARPAETALVAGERRLTYGELRSAAERLACHLAALGVGPGSRVGLGLDRCPELVVGLLAVLRAGGAYVPLDPAEPAGRLGRKMADAGLCALLTVERLAGRLPADETGQGPQRILLDAPDGWSGSAPPPAPSAAGEDDPAYLIFTSGSTGVPKAAGVTRRGLSNLLRWYREDLGFGPEDRMLVISAPSFDMTQKNLLAPLLAGGTVVLGPPVYDPPQLAELIARERITWLNCTPSAFYPLLELGGWERLASLALVNVGGEALAPARLAPWLASPCCRAVVINGYGPTECSDVVSCHRVSPRETATVPIGRPIPNARLLVLDRFLRELPVGAPGQIAVGGLCVGLGYLGDAAATAARFLPDCDPAAEPGARLYLTGDLGRRRPDGALEFLGRLDHQVKVRGFRVELGEIEAVLSSLPGIRQAAVTTWPDATGALQLAAYAAGEDLTASALRDGLALHLPAPLVPTAYVLLDRLPLNAHGKVDRRALPAPDPAALEAHDDFVPPRTPVEEVLAGVFAELLGRPQVGVRDDFFALGGHSLLASRVPARVRDLLGVELPVARLFEAPTVEALAREIAAGPNGAAFPPLPPLPPIVPVPRRPGDPLPLSFSQERLWFLDQLDPGSPAYNVPAAVRLSGRLDAGLLRRCFDAIAARHESLRTTFRTAGDRPVQVVAPALQVALPCVDLSALPAAPREAEAVRLAEAEARLPFDLAAGPLLRATLVRLAPAEHVALLNQHHIVSDAWSAGLLVAELADLYGHGAAGHALPPLGPDPLPPLPVQYADFALWQRGAAAAAKREADLAYWRQRLAGAPALLDLPADRPRPAVRSGRGSLRQAVLPPDVAAGLARLARREGATLFMALLAGFQTLLARYAGVRDLVVGAPIANRHRAETERLIGFFVNTLALRADLAGSPGWRELLARSRAAVLGATAHQDLPFERLVEELAPERNLAHAPVFQVVLALQNVPAVRPALPGLTLSPLELRRQDSKFDLGLAAHETAGGLGLGLVYSTDLFDAARMERLLGHFAALLAAAVAAPDAPVWELPLLAAAERHQALVEWNDPPDYPRGGLLHRLFERQAARTPDAVALVTDGGRLTYGELERRAGRVARHLRACGVGPGHVVGVCAARSPELIAGVLGIFKAGGVYLPLDPTLPPDRLAFLLADARPAAVLVQPGTGEVLPADGPPRLLLAELADAGGGDPQPAAEAPDGPSDGLLADLAAYVLYTSGSTGRPKGVVVPHCALANRMQYIRALETGASDLFLHKTTLNFDASITEMFGPLVSGATAVVARPGGERDTAYLVRRIQEEGITQVSFTASTLAVLVEDPDFAGCRSLRTVLAGGEAFPADLPERVFARLGADLYNRYGPTETTISVTSWRFRRGEAERVPPIGRPTAAAEAHVLDADLQPVPVGVPGELYLGGVCVARGYLGRPELTAAAFVPHPFASEAGSRLYRTGDLVRRRPDGALEFVARVDQQVKVRGFRIELGEIEALLVQHPGVQEVAAAALGTGLERRLAAFVVAGPEAGGDLEEDLRRHLARQVPSYMVPAAFVRLPALPMLPTGKVDRRALERLDPGRAAGAARRASYEPPATPFEELLAEIWSEVLRVERVGLHDDFFDLGGHSLQVTQVLLRVKERLGVEVPVRRFFEAPTLAGLALAVAEAMAAGADQEQLAEILAALE